MNNNWLDILFTFIIFIIVLYFKSIIQSIAHFSSSKFGGWLSKRFHHSNYQIKCKSLSPSELMGDRGKEDQGFMPNVYKQRQIDKQLKNHIEDNNTAMVILIGKYASGKSRTVYEFLKSSNCRYKYVYIPPTNNISTDEIVSTLKNLLNKKDETIIVLDDVNTLIEKEKSNQKGLEELFITLHQNFKTIFTIVKNSTNDFNNLIDITKRNTRNDSRKIIPIEIPDIIKGDDVYLFCVSNLKNDGESDVIGGFIPMSKRAIDANLNNLTDDGKKLVTTYFIATKYRQNFGKRKDVLIKLHNALWKVDPTDGFRQLTDSGVLKLSGEVYDIRNSVLYNAFRQNCRENNEFGIYLRNNHDSEKKQIDKYLTLVDENDKERTFVVFMSRFLLRVRHHDTIVYLKEKMDKKLRELYDNNNQDQIKLYVDGPICFLITNRFFRANKKDIINTYIENFNIEPTNNLGSSLIKSALTQSQRDEMSEYVNTLIKNNTINGKNIWDYQILEQTVINYDYDRIGSVIEYLRENNDDFIINHYRDYCGILLIKANCISKIDEFFRIVTYMKELGSPIRLKVDGRSYSINSYLNSIPCLSKNNSAQNSPLKIFMKSLYEHWDSFDFVIQDNVEDPNSAAFIKITNQAIRRTKIFNEGIELRLMALDKAQNMPSFNDKLQIYGNMFANIAITKVDLSSEEDKIAARKIINQNLDSPENVQELQKLMNTYFDRLESVRQILNEYRVITNNSIVKASTDTICIMLEKLRFNIEKNGYINYESIFKEIVSLKNNLGLPDTTYYCSSLWNIVSTLIDKKEDSNNIKKIKKVIPKGVIDDKYCECAKISALQDANDMLDMIEKYNGKFTEPDIISNLIIIFLKRFNDNAKIKNKLCNLVNTYIKNFEDLCDVYFYKELFSLKLFLKEITSFDKMTNYIHEKIEKLLEYDKPLSDKKKNGLHSFAIIDNNVNIENAYLLLEDIEIMVKNNNLYRDLWRPKLFGLFFKKLSTPSTPEVIDKVKIKLYINKVQSMIYRHPLDDYSEVIESIVRNIKIIKKRYNITNIGVDIPITSSNEIIRHKTWDMYKNENMLDNLNDYTIKKFKEQEERYLRTHPSKDKCYYNEADYLLGNRTLASWNSCGT